MLCPRCHRDFEERRAFCPFDGAPLTNGSRIDLFSSASTQQRGVVLGERYELRGFIGKGAMARVYLAKDLETGDAVAVKLLNKVSTRAEKARDRFLREARVTASIGHPNIVRILDVGLRRDGTPYLVMEVLHGESLGSYLRRETRADADIALPVLAQCASGLAAAHDKGVVHRDIKPDNVFLVGEIGDPYAVRVLDFGLAKFEAESGGTQTGLAVGTIEYMAPEQVVSDEPDGRTDVYGLGVTMYRMFTGQLPFAEGDDATLLAQQLLVPPPRPRDVAKGIDVATEAVITRALRKQRERRYPSIRVFLEDLERLSGEREGDLWALTNPEPKGPDTYAPEREFSQNAARFFERKLAAG